MATANSRCTPRPLPRKQLRLALVTETYPPEINGVANTLAQLASGLHARGHRVEIVRPRQPTDRPRSQAASPNDDSLASKPTPDTSAPGRAAQERLVPGLPLPGYTGLRFGLPVPRRLERAWCERRPDAIYIATEGPLGHAALHVANKLRIPTLTGFHTQFQQYCSHYGAGLLMGPIVQILRRFHNRSNATLVPTQHLKQELSALGFLNLHVLSRGVDTERFSPVHRSPSLRRSWGCGDEHLVALYVGRIAAEKNIELVVEAFNRIQTVTPDATCVLVGDGPELAHLRRQHPQFLYAGAKVGHELAVHYASADLFIFPSETETFGNVLLEALASGLAVVAFDYAAAREHLENDHNGYSVTFADHNAFVEQAEVAAGQTVQLKQLGRAARATAEGLSWQHVICELEQRIFTLIYFADTRGEHHEPIPATAE